MKKNADSTGKMSRRAFLGRSLTGMAALGMVPFIDLMADTRSQAAQWAKNARPFRFYMIGHGHIDPVWLWPWWEGVSVVMSTFRSALDRMNENPDFKFTTSSALFYQWAAENDPSLLEEIRRRIDEGRWELAGGWWVEPDVNIPDGEALVRQGLYGQLTFERLLGRRAVMGFNPDSFGHAATLPQILRKQGLESYVFMRPMAHEKTLPADLFWWEGPDGTRIPTSRIQIQYNNERSIRDRLERMIGESGGYGNPSVKTYMSFYGVADHGGGPTKENLRQIEEIRGQKDAPQLIYGTLGDYFAAVLPAASEGMPTVRDDLQIHAVGCYTAESAIKKGNRQSETALTTAEKVAATGAVAWGAAYPKEELTAAWKKVLFLQFHDSLAGTSLVEHSETARNGYSYALNVAERALAMAMQKLEWQVPSEDPESEYIVLFNPHAWETKSWVGYDFSMREEAAVTDDTGRALPHQWTLGSSQTGGVRKALFRVSLPPAGYRQIRVKRGGTPAESADRATAGERVLENRFLKVVFSTAGTVGITDKQSGREVFIGGETGCRAVVLNDTSDTWSHDVVAFTDESGAFGDAAFKVLENGPLRAVVRVTSTYGASSMSVDWILYADSPRLEAKVTLDWHEQWKMMRLSFPVNADRPAATYEVPYGAMERTREGQEVPGQRWVDLSGHAGGSPCGFAVINDAKYGYGTLGNDVRISIVRSPVFAHNAPNRLDPDKEYVWMDQGIQTFRLLLLPHAGDWREANIPRVAEEFSAAPVSAYQGIHGGSMPKSGSFFSVDVPGVVVTAMKQAERDGATILRCVETLGKQTTAELNLRFMGRTWRGDFGPFEIKSLRADPATGQISEVNLLEE